MGTEQLNASVKHSGDLVGAAELQIVYLWDLGPAKPEMPKRPNVPKGKEGEPEFDIAMIEFKEHLDAYTDAMQRFRKNRDEYRDWQEKVGGPVERRFWSCDAFDALARDPKRYCISARTRGHERLENHGLPAGMKPGKQHFENLRRQEAGDADLAEARRRDPVFGEQELRA